jgi:hypothetical protein
MKRLELLSTAGQALKSLGIAIGVYHRPGMHARRCPPRGRPHRRQFTFTGVQSRPHLKPERARDHGLNRRSGWRGTIDAACRRLAPSITRRHRKRQHLRHRSQVDPKASCRFPLTDPLYINCSSYLCVQFHSLHPSAHLCRATANGLLLPDFYSGATGLSDCY